MQLFSVNCYIIEHSMIRDRKCLSFFFTTDSKHFPGGRDGYSAAQRHVNIKTSSKLVQHAQVNALHFKCALGARIHYVPPTRSSQVAIVILLICFFLNRFFLPFQVK